MGISGLRVQRRLVVLLLALVFLAGFPGYGESRQTLEASSRRTQGLSAIRGLGGGLKVLRDANLPGGSHECQGL